MKKSVITLIFTLLTFSISAHKISPKEFYRLEECSRIIDLAGSVFWPPIQGFRGPWVYVTNEGQYLVNFKEKHNGFVEIDFSNFDQSYFKPKIIQWKNIGQVTINGEDHSNDPVFVFNSISTKIGDPDYNNPITYVSSFEIVKKVVPLLDTEDWISLFLHEVFHQFQFSNEKIFNHYFVLKKNKLYMSSSELADFYKLNNWFKELIKKENRLLLQARKENKINKKREFLTEFYKLRNVRRLKFKNVTGKSLAEIEAFWEMIEGGARYFEYATFRVLKNSIPNGNLINLDSQYGSNKRYKESINIETMENLDKDLKRTRYFYTTGFNLYMLLEELRSDFYNQLFNNSPMYLEKMLGL